jgi:DNA-binding transcriptional regulator YiaG
MTGQDIKTIRNKLLLLQQELADDLGLHIETIKSWEQGRRNISIKSQRLVLEYCKKKGVEV